MTATVEKALSCGAKSSSIASFLRDKRYVCYTYGWDEIRDGHYYVYDSERDEWYLDDSLLKIENEKEVTPDFYHLVAIDSAIVTTLKKLLA